jgi:ABC-type transport system involved in multi-copper enzyme maturation permease subunit
MEETVSTPPVDRRPARWKTFIHAISENPVILKELRKRMRGRQAYILLFAYLVIISVFMVLIYASSRLGNISNLRWSPQARQALGKGIFSTIVLTELLLIALISPALTSGAIAAEREHQTLDLLRTTLLTTRSLVLGKLGSAFSYVFLLIFAAVPLQSMAFLIGGVGMPELLISGLLMIVTAFFFCSLGLFFSSFLKRTSVANVASYIVIVVSTVTMGVGFFAIGVISSSSSHLLSETAIALVAWFFISTNPLLAAIISETLLVDSQSLFFTTQGMFGSTSFPLPSPWIPFTVIYLVTSIIMIILSIQFVKRPDR